MWKGYPLKQIIPMKGDFIRLEGPPLELDGAVLRNHLCVGYLVETDEIAILFTDGAEYWIYSLCCGSVAETQLVFPTWTTGLEEVWEDEE
jgi:hypothetical protein